MFSWHIYTRERGYNPTFCTPFGAVWSWRNWYADHVFLYRTAPNGVQKVADIRGRGVAWAQSQKPKNAILDDLIYAWRYDFFAIWMNLGRSIALNRIINSVKSYFDGLGGFILFCINHKIRKSHISASPACASDVEHEELRSWTRSDKDKTRSEKRTKFISLLFRLITFCLGTSVSDTISQSIRNIQATVRKTKATEREIFINAIFV